MCAKIFTSMVDIETYIGNKCSIAIKNTAIKLQEKLKEYINEDYYELYSPSIYDRTYKFLNSATHKMLNENYAEVGFFEDYLNYNYPSRYTSKSSNYEGHWTGEDQLYAADAGIHGNVSIQTDGHFFKDFIQYCNENAINILREELKKQGINTK